jgi:hypothetical protein
LLPPPSTAWHDEHATAPGCDAPCRAIRSPALPAQAWLTVSPSATVVSITVTGEYRPDRLAFIPVTPTPACCEILLKPQSITVVWYSLYNHKESIYGPLVAVIISNGLKLKNDLEGTLLFYICLPFRIASVEPDFADQNFIAG